MLLGPFGAGALFRGLRLRPGRVGGRGAQLLLGGPQLVADAGQLGLHARDPLRLGGRDGQLGAQAGDLLGAGPGALLGDGGADARRGQLGAGPAELDP